MCGRYRRTTSEEELARLPIPIETDLPISYNIAPSQKVLTTANGKKSLAERSLLDRNEGRFALTSIARAKPVTLFFSEKGCRLDFYEHDTGLCAAPRPSGPDPDQTDCPRYRSRDHRRDRVAATSGRGRLFRSATLHRRSRGSRPGWRRGHHRSRSNRHLAVASSRALRPCAANPHRIGTHGPFIDRRN